MTKRISNVLHHLKELNQAWRKQDFIFTKEQQQQYDFLIATRRERIHQLYAEGRVSKGSYKPKGEEF